LFIAFGKFLIIAKGNSFGKFLRLFDFTELFFDRLLQFDMALLHKSECF